MTFSSSPTHWPVWLSAAATECLLLVAFFLGVGLSHSGALGLLAAIVWLPQAPGLFVAGTIIDALVRRHGTLPTWIGAFVFFPLVFLVQWALLAILFHLWRSRAPRTPTGPRSPRGT